MSSLYTSHSLGGGAVSAALRADPALMGAPPGRGSGLLGTWGAAPEPIQRARPARRQVVSLVIPTRNEAANIAWVLAQVPPCIDEVIVVDGRSSDATVVTALAARPDARIVVQPGSGKGDALHAGFREARGDILVMLDADGSMSPGEIPHYLHFLDNGYDLVKGSRFMAGGGSRDITAFRRMGNKALVRLVNSLYDAQLTDLCYGFCAFHRRYLDHLDLTTPGFDVEAKMVVSALKAGLRVAEVPSLEMPRRFGRSNLHAFRDGTSVLRTILREHEAGVTGHAVQHVRHWVHGSEGAATDAGSVVAQS